MRNLGPCPEAMRPKNWRNRQRAVTPASYCPGNGGMLTLATFGTGTTPAPFREVSEQFVPVRLKPITVEVPRALETSTACEPVPVPNMGIAYRFDDPASWNS